MDVSKGEIYFREKIGKIRDEGSIFNTELNLLILEWVETCVKGNLALVELTPSFLPFREVVFDVIWLLSQSPGNINSVADTLRHIILYDPLSLSKLAIERLDPDLLEQAGVITMFSALIKKISRINTLMNYKFNKNFFIESCPQGFSEILTLCRNSSTSSIGEGWRVMRKEFLRMIGKWELDLYRVVDLILIENELCHLFPFLEFCGIEKKIIRQVFKIKFKIIWKFQREEKRNRNR